MRVLFHNQMQQYQLLLDEATGDKVLSVLCGRVGMYGVEVKLTPEQVEAYEEQGQTVLDVYAKQVWEEEDRKLLERRRLNYEASLPPFALVFSCLPWWHRWLIIASAVYVLFTMVALFILSSHVRTVYPPHRSVRGNASTR